MPADFSYDALPGRVVFGAGKARTALAAETKRLDGERVLVIASNRDRALVDELVAPLGDRLAGVFSGIGQHVPIEVATAARDRAEELDVDCLLCIGGGSAIGAAKAIALDRPVPIVAVPTTYAGSEMTPVWGLTEGGRKTTGRDPNVLPATVVYDPLLTLSLPATISAPSGVNAIAHCVEALWVPATSPVAGLLAEEGIRALGRSLPAVVANGDDVEARTDALYGAYLAGAAFAVTGSGLHHRICHLLGGSFGLPHAQTHTIVLPYVVAFNEPAAPEVMRRIAAALEVSSAPRGLQELTRRLGTPRSLREIGLRDVDAAVKLLLEKDFSDNVRPVTEAGLRTIIGHAYDGTALP
ncbi:maleylacetate reductase [Fodinicola acaciae]|uniref:maleylacetate reductase n=1 Tax=Fodinicola acaciae TaxID=2681555 RepID=UPI0013D66AF5|nr:maleylacetate reductase [Fodinicola acaciae]